MSVTIIDVPQRDPAWFAARCGRLTGSRAADMLATIKSGEAAARRNLRTQLVVERLTGTPQEGDGFISAAMQRGIDKEPDAFAAYEALTGNVVRRTGFLRHDVFPVGCSLDGDIDGLTGILELKCPQSATHLDYLTTKAVPKTHLPQIMHNLWVSGAAWCDFVSFDDRFPPHLQVFHRRVMRADVDLAAYERAALAFLAEVEQQYQALVAMGAPAVQEVA